jgi:Flp pilus assembly protein TadB
MSHSDYELKVLADLEQSLLNQDPRMVKSLSRGDSVSWWKRRALRGVAGFAVGAIILVVSLTVSLWCALVGIALMTVSAFVIEQGVRCLVRSTRSTQDTEFD